MWPTSYWALNYWNAGYWERPAAVPVPPVTPPEAGSVTGLLESSGQRGGYTVPQEFWRGPIPIDDELAREIEEDEEEKKRRDRLARIIAEDDELLELIYGS